MFNQERAFGFIEWESGPDLHFGRRDFQIRDRDPVHGLAVEFSVKKSYDPRRKCESWSAVYVTLRRDS